jgi:soluble lytic murein transglycosylase
MTGRLARFPSLLLVLALLATPSVAPAPAWGQTAEQGRLLAQALEAGRSGKWVEASALAGRANSGIVSDIVFWARLREGVGSWQEYSSFLARNAAWPNIATIRRQGERTIPANADPGAVLTFFGGEPPRTGTGALRLAEALAARGRGSEAQAMIRRVWPDLALTREEQAAILARHGGLLAADHVARLDNLLWNDRLTEAEAMLPLVDAGWQALARARIGLRRDVGNTTQLINAVPERLRADPGLAHDRFQWRVRKGRWDEAEDWLAQHSVSAAALGRPEAWMARRPGLVRQALRKGNVARAYALAARNFGSEGSDYAESEWLAGFIALTRMNDPSRAIAHFQRFERAVFTPISLGRAGFWLGLAHERAGQGQAARAAFARAAQHQTSFYGQLAAERIGAPADPRLAGNGAPNWRQSAVMRSPVVQAGYLLHLAGDEARASLFLRHAAESMGANDRAALAQMAIDLGRPHIGVRLAKDAAAAGIIIPSQYYPIHDMARTQWPVPTEFALAIARQESEFNPRAVSHAGARGLMQLMPATAQTVSRQLGLGYDAGRLLSDPAYNARLGTAYLAQMLRDFGGSYILAAAAYNAGPGRVRQWIGQFGDPRRPDVDTVVWIESIPFNETRNYVMRVMEALHVYRARMNGRAEPVRLVADLNRAS